MAASSPERLFAERLGGERAQPLITYYDQRSGERAELSAASLANWVTKTFFLLTDELGLEVADRAAVRLPVHWMRYVVLLGAWSAGLTVVDGPPAAVGFGHDPDDLRALADAAPDVYGLALAPWGQGYPAGPPEGAEDFVAAVRPQSDVYSMVRFPAASDVAAVPGSSRTQFAAAAEQRAGELGLQPGGRLLIHDSSPHADDLLTWTAPLAAAGSVVLIAGGSEADTARLADVERVTVVL